MHKEWRPRLRRAAHTAPAGHAAAPGTPPTRGTDPARAPGASPGDAAAAAVGREGAKYRAHANPTHTRTSPPKPFPLKLIPTGQTRHVRPPGARALAAGRQRQRQQDAWRVIQEGGDGVRAG